MDREEESWYLRRDISMLSHHLMRDVPLSVGVQVDVSTADLHPSSRVSILNMRNRNVL